MTDLELHRQLNFSIQSSVKFLTNKRFRMGTKVFINHSLLTVIKSVQVISRAYDVAQKTKHPYTVFKSRKSK